MLCMCGCEAQNSCSRYSNNVSLLFPILPHFEGRSYDNYIILHCHCFPNTGIPDMEEGSEKEQGGGLIESRAVV